MPEGKVTAGGRSQVDMVVVSTACHTAINRAIYRLFAQSGISILLVIPKGLQIDSRFVPSQPPASDDPPIVFLELSGQNPRSFRFLGLTVLLDQYRPSLILLDNDPGSVTALQMGLWAARAKARFFSITCENLPLGAIRAIGRRGVRHLPAAIAKRVLMSVAKRLIDGVFTISDQGTEVFIADGFTKVRRIPLGFDPKYFRIDHDARRSVREQLGLTGFVVGFFGRLSLEKGIHVLIQALGNLKDCPWTLMMDSFDRYASPYGEEVFRQLGSNQLLDRVVFINPTHVEMGAYLNAADVVVLPSISTPTWIEQYGRVAPEAMACGRLVVASRVGALPLLLGDYGILFPEGDVDALTTILHDLVTGDTASRNLPSPERISEYAHSQLGIESQFREMIPAFSEKHCSLDAPSPRRSLLD